jgi:hypothetical protein
VQTKLGAEQHERERRNELQNPTPAPPKVYPTLGQFIEKEWLPTYPAAGKNRPSTVREKRKHLSVHIVPALGNVRINEVSKRCLDEFLAGLTKKGLSPKTCVNVCLTLRRILRSALEWDVIETMAAFPRIKVNQPDWDWFTERYAHLPGTGAEAIRVLDDLQGSHKAAASVKPSKNENTVA